MGIHQEDLMTIPTRHTIRKIVLSSGAVFVLLHFCAFFAFIAYGISGPEQMEAVFAWFPALVASHVAAVLTVVGMMAHGTVHMLTNHRLDAGMRVAWTLGLWFVTLPVLPIYWALYVFPAEPVTA
jgi:hypothetical protein